MWIIWKELPDGNMHIVASHTDTKNDVITAELSLMRGPNRVVWYHRNPTEDTVMNSKTGDAFYFTMEGPVKWKIECTIESISWENNDSMRIVLIPTIHYMSRFPIKVTSSTAKTLGDVIKSMYDTKRVDVKVSSNLKNTKSHDGGTVYSSRLDYLAYLAYKYNCEFYLSDKYVRFGGILDTRNTNDIINNTNLYNTISRTKIGDMMFYTFTSDTTMDVPGKMIKYEGKYHKIIYTKVYWGPLNAIDPKMGGKQSKRHVKVSGMEVTTVCIDVNEWVTEYQLASFLNPIDKEILMLKYQITTLKNSYITHNKTDDQELYMLSETDVESSDMLGLKDSKFKSNLLTRIVRTTPFAADKVGLQFPATPNSYDVVVTNEMDDSTPMSVGQIWQDKVPVRGSIEDMRWTFADGSSLYWDAGAKAIRILAKGKLIIGVDTAASWDKEPEDAEQGIVVDSNGVTIEPKKGGAIVLKNGTTSITINKNGTVEVDGTNPLGMEFLSKANHIHAFNHSHTAPSGPTSGPIPITTTDEHPAVFDTKVLKGA